MKRLVIALIVLVTALGAPSAALASGDTAAVAINTRDGASVFRLAFAIKRVAGDVVDTANAAVAFSSCTDCRTTAIAIQVVLITGDAETIAPENIAMAINVECTLCVTFAAAYQYVLTTDGQVHFTAEGNHEIAQIRRELQALRRDELSPEELDARLRQLMQRLATVLRNELVAAGSSGGTRTGTTTAPTQTATTPTQTQTAPAATTPTTTETAPPETATTETTETTPTP